MDTLAPDFLPLCAPRDATGAGTFADRDPSELVPLDD